jgi:hypothetical protein
VMRQANTQQTADSTPITAGAQVGSDDMETAQLDRLDGTRVDNPEPSHEAIARRAHALWEERGRPEGSQEEDWFRAQDELRNQSGDAGVERAFCEF